MPTWRDLEALHYDLEAGGKFKPTDCTARHNVAIVVPYRDREKQLFLFIQNLHPFLKRQKISYAIYIIEQVSGKAFNRGLVRNIGFTEALKLDSTHDCTIFHDVDLIPLHEANMYTCPDQPRHVCVAVNYIQNFTPLYTGIAEFGHVVSFRNDHFRLVNGYSNIYLGWGAEDDDLHKRVKAKQMKPYRYPDYVAKYYGVPHADESLMPRPDTKAKNVDRLCLLKFAERRMNNDGLTSLRYKVVEINKSKLFTRILVSVEEDSYAFEALSIYRRYKTLYDIISVKRRKHQLL